MLHFGAVFMVELVDELADELELIDESADDMIPMKKRTYTQCATHCVLAVNSFAFYMDFV